MAGAVALAMAAIALCDWKGCGKAASHKFRWEWGEEGNVCPACVQLMNQTAENLSRKVQFTNLDQNAVAPLGRSERTQLIAAKLSAEAELEEVQARGHELYKQNVDLSAQVQTHVMRAREHQGQMTAKDAEIDALLDKLESRERELAETSAELQRLRVQAPFVDPKNVVGGPAPKGSSSKAKPPEQPPQGKPPEGG